MIVSLLAVYFGYNITFAKSDYKKVFHFLFSFNFANPVSERITLSHSLNEDDNDDKHIHTHIYPNDVFLQISVEKLNYIKILMYESEYILYDTFLYNIRRK